MIVLSLQHIDIIVLYSVVANATATVIYVIKIVVRIVIARTIRGHLVATLVNIQSRRVGSYRSVLYLFTFIVNAKYDWHCTLIQSVFFSCPVIF